MPFVAGGAPATPPGGPLSNPRAPLLPSKKKFQNLLISKLFFLDLVWPNLWLFFVSSLAPFFEVIGFLILEPLGVDFELSS